MPGSLLLVLDAFSLLLHHALAGPCCARNSWSLQRRFGRHSLPSLFKAILMDKFSIITVFESRWSPSRRFGSNPVISLPACCEIPKSLLLVLNASSLCRVRKRWSPQRCFGRHTLPSLLRALASLWTKSQSQHSPKAAGLLQVTLGVISPLTPLCWKVPRSLLLVMDASSLLWHYAIAGLCSSKPSLWTKPQW